MTTASRPHFRLGTAVDRRRVGRRAHTYTLTLDNGEEVECNVARSARSDSSTFRVPDWPGLDDFQGPKFHTARWEHEHDLTGKTVAVVGTGSPPRRSSPRSRRS